MILVICVPAPGYDFYRCGWREEERAGRIVRIGLCWSAGVTELPDGALTREQIDTLKRDPGKRITVIEVPEPAPSEAEIAPDASSAHPAALEPAPVEATSNEPAPVESSPVELAPVEATAVLPATVEAPPVEPPPVSSAEVENRFPRRAPAALPHVCAPQALAFVAHLRAPFTCALLEGTSRRFGIPLDVEPHGTRSIEPRARGPPYELT